MKTLPDSRVVVYRWWQTQTNPDVARVFLFNSSSVSTDPHLLKDLKATLKIMEHILVQTNLLLLSGWEASGGLWANLYKQQQPRREEKASLLEHVHHSVLEVTVQRNHCKSFYVAWQQFLQVSNKQIISIAAYILSQFWMENTYLRKKFQQSIRDLLALHEGKMMDQWFHLRMSWFLVYTKTQWSLLAPSFLCYQKLTRSQHKGIRILIMLLWLRQL